MSIIISDDIYYFHKGFLNDEWKQVKFEFYRNGHLARLNSEGITEKTIDLKKHYNSIKIKPALEFIICKQHTNDAKKSPINFNVDKDSKLMVIPNRTGNKWILLFLKSEKLNEWMKHIKKWACVPKIKVEVYNDNREEDGAKSIEFFQQMKNQNRTSTTNNKEETTKICKKFSFKNNVFGLISNHANTNSNNQLIQQNEDDKRKIRPLFGIGQMVGINSQA